MNTFISMLRGINVSGQKRVGMTALKSLYESLGMLNVRTYVQSGNLVFESNEQSPSKLANMIEVQIERSLGFSVSVFIREPKDFEQIIASNPFLKRNEDPSKLHVTFLDDSLLGSALSNLAMPNKEGDEFFAGDKGIYLFCPNGYGRTKLSNAFFERKLKVAATTRNWKTVNALYKIALETS
jgi:uncharacterized protein (DUF1697 family)